MTHKLIKTTDYILVVDDSLTIGKGYAVNRDYEIMKYNTDEHLAYDSYAVKKIIAHLPLNGSPILQGVDLLPPYSRYQEDGLEELAENSVSEVRESNPDFYVRDVYKEFFKEGYNKAREKYKLTLSKLIDLYVNETGYGMDMWSKEEDETMSTIAKIIQSLHQYPTEFETEDVLTPSQIFYPNDVPYCSPKTITTAQGVQWVGKYLK